jgi:hypothetical protein
MKNSVKNNLEFREEKFKISRRKNLKFLVDNLMISSWKKYSFLIEERYDFLLGSLGRPLKWKVCISL